MPKDEISLITLNYNDADTTIRFINKIKDYKNINHIIVVDNKSSDNSFEKLIRYSSNKVKVISSKRNGGYGYGNNCGIKFAFRKFNSQYIIIANPDVTFNEDTINSLRKLIDINPKLLMVSAVMTDKKGNKKNNTAWKILPCFKYIINEGALIRRIFKLDEYRNIFNNKKETFRYVDCLAGSFFMLEKNKLFWNGVYDENMFLYCEEDYLGIKLRKSGYLAALLLTDSFIHSHGKIINKVYSRSKQDKLIFENKIYILRRYMNASNTMLCFARLFFNICIIERFVGRELKLF